MQDIKSEQKTTQDLRLTLFGVIDGLLGGTIDVQAAAVVCKSADQILKSAALELKATETKLKLEQMETDVAISEVFLLSDKSA